MAERIRAFMPDDIPEVARMFTRVFLRRTGPGPASLMHYLDELFFRQPDRDPELASLVYVDTGGSVRGFMGVLPRRMLFRGEQVRAAAGSSLMVDDPAAHPTAGARLVRTFLKGPQDITFSESANAVAQRMWAQVGAQRLATASMDWFRVLRPSGFAVWKAARGFSPLGWLNPLSRATDRLIQRVGTGRSLEPQCQQGITERDIAVDELVQLLTELSAHYPLRPDWSAAQLQVMMEHAADKERYGKLYCRAVYDRHQRPIGCYLYHGRPGNLAMTLQVLAKPGMAGATLDSMLRHAWELGCVGLRGRTQHDLLDALLDRKCFFVHFSATMLYSRRKEVEADVRAGGGLLTGLAGEGWCKLIGGRFD